MCQQFKLTCLEYGLLRVKTPLTCQCINLEAATFMFVCQVLMSAIAFRHRSILILVGSREPTSSEPSAPKSCDRIQKFTISGSVNGMAVGEKMNYGAYFCFFSKCV
jgi:hypothetical protein